MSRKSGRRGYNSDTSTASNRGSGSREPREEEIVDLEEEEEEEEEDLIEEEGGEDEEDEITRCICGQDELTNDSINPELSTFLKRTYKIEIDQGLFIQCEKCSVWQHGYCVGLFESHDVPDEYWCESCKPEFHILVNNDGYSKRTLYKPVNDKRKKLEQMTFKNNETSHSTRRRGGKNERNTPQQDTSSNIKDKRKERRHHHHHHNIDEDDDEYNEQLKRALRESARESGVKLSESESNERGNGNSVKREDNKSDGNNSSGREGSRGNGSRKRETNRRENADNSDSKRLKVEQSDHPSGSELNENSEQELGSGSEGSRSKRRGVAGAGAGAGSTKTTRKKKSTPPRLSTNNNNNNNKKQDDSSNETNSLGPTKEELIQQPSKPRYVNDKSSIFELRKRTIAILEWLGRSQVELQEEKQQKLELFSFISDDDEKEGSSNSSKENANADALALKETFDENLLLMEQLTERILAWQDTFGKYAV